MPIDRSGEWWRGTNFDDLREYVILLTEEGYPAREVIQSRCACGNLVFRLERQRGDVVRRVCDRCGVIAYIGDSDEYMEEEDEFETCTCPCGSRQFEVGVGFSFCETEELKGEVKWITVGERCVRCGVLGSCADWKISALPTAHLLRKT